MRKFLFGVSSKATGALASHISLLANTLDSLTGPRALATGSLLANLALPTFSTSSGGLGDFLEPLSHHAGVVTLLMLPQREDALVLLDLRDVAEIEEVSEAGEERPDELSEYTEGLVGRMEDSEIQWCSCGSSVSPDQREVDVS